jgi:HEPN domain-containing protein
VASHGETRSRTREIDATIDDGIERDASALDNLYLMSRYPDTIGDEDPGDIIAPEDAGNAVGRATRVVSFVDARLAALVSFLCDQRP